MARQDVGVDRKRQAVDLRQIGPGEWQLWREVRLRALAEAPYAFGSTLAFWQGSDLEDRWRSRLADVPLNVVAVAAGSPVGQVSGTALDPEGRVELISMWVDPAVRGAGVAETLVSEVVDWARGTCAAVVVLSVKKQNAPAIGLYRRVGFEPTDEPADDGEIRMRFPLS